MEPKEPSISFYLAGDYYEYYQRSDGLWRRLHFFLSDTNEYMNALDLMGLLGYRNCYTDWESVYSELKDELGKIELEYQYVYVDGVLAEPFLNLHQIVEVVAAFPRWTESEKMSFMEWLEDAAPWTDLIDDDDTEIFE